VEGPGAARRVDARAREARKNLVTGELQDSGFEPVYTLSRQNNASRTQLNSPWNQGFPVFIGGVAGERRGNVYSGNCHDTLFHGGRRGGVDWNRYLYYSG